MIHQFCSLLWRRMIGYTFTGRWLKMKNINFCNRNNSSEYITGTSMQSQAPPVIFLRIHPYFEIIDIYIWARRFILHQCAELNRFICKKTAFRTLNDRFLSRVCILAYAKATSGAVSFACMESAGGHDVWQSFMHITVEQHFMTFNKVPGHSTFYHERRILNFYCLIFDNHGQLRRLVKPLISTSVEVPVIVYQAW